jgi:dipeptidyl aminopeptidase/acylaminoacyl peptidase
MLAHPVTGKAQAYQSKYLRSEWIALDPAIRDDLELVKTKLRGEVAITSRSNADDRWIVEVDPVTSSPRTYLFERESDRLTELFVSRPEIEPLRLAAMHPLELRARDGLTLPSYLTLPVGSDPDGDGRPEDPLPLVLLVHGGPWLRDSFGYDPYHQWLANRGYAVLSVNFRGSAGFGKSFISAGDREWGGKMHQDLLDAVGWATSSGVALPERVAIMGASYGGYATLAGLAFTPEVFACGVDVVGPSNLLSLLAATPPYWESLKRQLYKRVGDPRTPEGEAFLRERSPLFSVEAIRKPLLIAQGANDPRVPRAESDQIVDAMGERGIPVTYLLFPDEGHGLARPENVIGFTAVAENFLQPCLGGRAEPIASAAGRSSMEVLRGPEHVEGLASSLAARAAQVNEAR